MKKVRVAFLFQGARHNILDAIASDQSPDSLIYGGNHVARFLAETHACDFLNQRGIWGTFKLLRSYDVVVSGIGLPVLLLQRLLIRRRPRWIYINLNLTSVLSAYPQRSLKRAAMILALRCADRIICPSTEQRSYLLAQGLRPERLTVIHYGVDKHFFKPTETTGTTILSVGKDKGRDYETLIRAAEHIDAPFVIVAAKRNIEGEGITEVPANVSVQYGKTYAEYRELLNNALIVVVPLKKDAAGDSSDCSGQTVALEALSAGKPLVLTRRAWAAEYLKADEHALLVEPGNAEALRHEIVLLLADEAMRARFSAAGRRLIETQLNTERMGEAVANIIAAVVPIRKSKL